MLHRGGERRRSGPRTPRDRERPNAYTSARWTSTSSGPQPRPRSGPRSTRTLDPEIGPARSGWDGGARDTAADGHISHGGHDARARRDLLLPALEAAATRVGWVSRGALNHVSKRLAVPPAEAYGVASFYALLPTTPRPPIVAHVCDDLACRLPGRGADLR